MKNLNIRNVALPTNWNKISLNKFKKYWNFYYYFIYYLEEMQGK